MIKENECCNTTNLFNVLGVMEKKKEAKFGLANKITGELIKYEVYPVPAGSDSCGDMVYALCDNGDFDWLVDDSIAAEYVRTHSTPWYNANHDTPKHSINPDDYRVVEVIIQLKPVDVSLPTIIEMIEWMFRRDNPLQADFLMKEVAQGEDITFEIPDYQAYSRDRKENE